MKTRAKRILLMMAGVLLTGICGVAGLGYYFLSPNSPLNRASAVDAVLSWGRLAPFPRAAKHISMTTEGGMFTRAFRASFTAPAADIEQWLQQSPGTRNTQPSSPAPGVRYFEIAAGGGAQWAEVTVDDNKGLVSIYVYWS